MSSPDVLVHAWRAARRPRRILAIALGLIGACTARGQAPRPAGELPVLRAGTSGDYPPFSERSGVLDDRSGERAGDRGTGQGDRFSGFSVALVEAYAAERGRRVEWVRFRWPDLVSDLEAGRFALADSGITVRPERSIAGRYTVPVVRTGAVLLLRRPAWAPPADAAGDSLAAIRALDQPRLRVAVNRGGHLERVARSQFRLAQITAIPDNAAVRDALVNGQVDAALTNTIEAPHWAAGSSGIERIGPLTRDFVAIYVRAEQRELAADLDAWLLAQEASGALARMRARYLGSGADEPTALPVQALLAATAERLALMPLVGTAKQRAGMPIDDAAQEARVLAAARTQVYEISAALGLTAPRDEALTEFFQAQMDAAKTVQRRAQHAAGTDSPAPGPAYSLDEQLRPAIARISERMAALLPRVPGGLDPRAVRQLAREYLAASGLEDDEGGRTIDRIADAIVALGAPSGTSLPMKRTGSARSETYLPVERTGSARSGTCPHAVQARSGPCETRAHGVQIRTRQLLLASDNRAQAIPMLGEDERKRAVGKREQPGGGAWRGGPPPRPQVGGRGRWSSVTLCMVPRDRGSAGHCYAAIQPSPHDRS